MAPPQPSPHPPSHLPNQMRHHSKDPRHPFLMLKNDSPCRQMRLAAAETPCGGSCEAQRHPAARPAALHISMLHSLNDMLHSACIQHLGPCHPAEPMYRAHPPPLGCCFLSLASAPPIGALSDSSGPLLRPLPCHQPTVVTAPMLRLRVALHRAGRMLHCPTAGLIAKQHSTSLMAYRTP